MTSTNADLPKTIQFYNPASCSSKYNNQNRQQQKQQQRSPLLIITSILLLITTISIIIQQQRTISTLQNEASITQSHRAYLERSQTNLLQQLTDRDTSLNQYKHTHAQLQKVTADMSSSMLKLRQEYTEAQGEADTLRMEVERLKGENKDVERRGKWNEVKWNRFVNGIGEDSRRSVVET